MLWPRISSPQLSKVNCVAICFTNGNSLTSTDFPYSMQTPPRGFLLVLFSLQNDVPKVYPFNFKFVSWPREINVSDRHIISTGFWLLFERS